MAGISGKVTNFLAKATGAAGLALIAYDAHSVGKRESYEMEKTHKTEWLKNNYLNDMKFNSQSEVEREVKRQIFNFNLNENITGVFTSIVGYLKGFGSIFVENIIPLGLAVGTFVGKKGGRNLISKFSALGLLAYGGISLVQEIFGIGKSRNY